MHYCLYNPCVPGFLSHYDFSTCTPRINLSGKPRPSSLGLVPQCHIYNPQDYSNFLVATLDHEMANLISTRVVLKHYRHSLRLTLKQTCPSRPQHRSPPVLDLKTHLTSTHCQTPARTESRHAASR